MLKPPLSQVLLSVCVCVCGFVIAELLSSLAILDMVGNGDGKEGRVGDEDKVGDGDGKEGRVGNEGKQ